MAVKLLPKVYVKDTILANDEIVIRVELARLDEKERYHRGGPETMTSRRERLEVRW